MRDEPERPGVQDRRYCPFVEIDKDTIDRYLPEVGLDGLGLFILLRKLASDKEAMPDDASLSGLAGCTEGKIKTVLNKLKKAGLARQDGNILTIEPES